MHLIFTAHCLKKYIFGLTTNVLQRLKTKSFDPPPPPPLMLEDSFDALFV
jgi:hypothetical protein